MVTEEKKKAINRLAVTRDFRALVDKMYLDGIEAYRAGTPTAWAMVNWWQGESILKAMGVVIVYPENFGAACAADGAAEAYLERCEAEGFPSHLCGYGRNSLGYTATMMELGEIPAGAPLGGMDKPLLLLGSGAFCDARYKWFQALGKYMDVPVWVLEFPTPGVKESALEGVYEYTIKFIVKELREFVAFAERLLGKKLDWDKLSEVVDNVEQVIQVWHEANELRKAVPGPMHSRDFWTCMVPCYYMAGEKESLEVYRKLYDEVKQRVDSGIGAIADEKYRMLFADLPPWHSLKFFDPLAEMGWNFVIESILYHPPLPLDLSGVSDPLERIARYTYQVLAGRYHGALKAGEETSAQVYPYLEWARDYKCDGALLHPLLSCRTASFYLMHARERLMESLKVPSLVVEGDIVDLKVFDQAQALNQAEAFNETMEHYKKVRKEEGLEW
ncbi:MAG: 2-hydroxyacyl-CoA dehydratase subunit D [Dehalococcoidia bacterium]